MAACPTWRCLVSVCVVLVTNAPIMDGRRDRSVDGAEEKRWTVVFNWNAVFHVTTWRRSEKSTKVINVPCGQERRVGEKEELENRRRMMGWDCLRCRKKGVLHENHSGSRVDGVSGIRWHNRGRTTRQAIS